MKEKTKVKIIKMIPILIMFGVFVYYIVDYSVGRIGNERFMVDTYTIFLWIIKDTYSSFLGVAGPAIIIFLAIYDVNKKFRSLDIKTSLNRETYENYIKKIFKGAYKYSFVLPIMVAIVFIICALLYRTFDYEYYIAMDGGKLSTFPIKYLKMPVRFGFVYMTNLALMSSVYISLGLLCVKKNKNLIASVLEGTLAYFGGIYFWVFVVEYSVKKITGVFLSYYVDFFDLITYNSRKSLLTSVLSILLLAIIMFVCVIKSYKNKEEVIMCLERNAEGYEED